jgi:hypothetical protein
MRSGDWIYESNSTVTALWRLAAGEVSTKGIILSTVRQKRLERVLTTYQPKTSDGFAGLATKNDHLGINAWQQAPKY